MNMSGRLENMRSFSSVRLAGLLLTGALGCGLISSDITKVTFDLPAKHYVFSSQGFVIPAGANQRIPCGAGQVVATCPAPLTCDDGVCTAHVPVTVVQKMDLGKEVPALAGHQSIANITLERLRYSVVSTANVPLPPIELFLAPDGVMDPSDSRAARFGTVPMIAAGESVEGDVAKEPGADDTFTMYGHDLATPFNFIASTTVSVQTGTTPSGTVDITINGTIAAKISL
jgi:hypothetical protein